MLLHQDALDICPPLELAEFVSWLRIKAEGSVTAQAADMKSAQGGLFTGASQPARPAIDPINIGPGLLQSLQSLTQTHQQPPQQQVHVLLLHCSKRCDTDVGQHFHCCKGRSCLTNGRLRNQCRIRSIE